MKNTENHIIAYLRDRTNPQKLSQKLFEMDPATNFKNTNVLQLKELITENIPKQGLNNPDNSVYLLQYQTDPDLETVKPDGMVYDKKTGQLRYDPAAPDIFDPEDELILSAPVQALTDKDLSYYILQNKNGETKVLEESDDYSKIQNQAQFLRTYTAISDDEIQTTALPKKFADLNNEAEIVPREGSGVHWSYDLSPSISSSRKEKEKMASKIIRKGKQAAKKIPGFACKVTTKNKNQFYFRFTPVNSQKNTIECFQITPKGISVKKENRKSTDIRKTGNQFIQDQVGTGYTQKEIPLADFEKIKNLQQELKGLRHHDNTRKRNLSDPE